MNRTLLLVDIGNSRLKWALAQGRELHAGMPFCSAAKGLTARLERHWSALGPPASVHVASVAGPDRIATVGGWVRARWGLELRCARTEASRGGVSNGYERPAQLGVDRWLGLLGLHRAHALPACLADCGTAITLDVLDADGQHRGGLIAPGLATMQRSLSKDTHALGLTPGQWPDAGALGRDTAAGIRAGCVLACAGLVEKALAELGHAGRAPVRLVMTGGDATTIGRRLAIPHVIDEPIVLRGLLAVAESRGSDFRL